MEIKKIKIILCAIVFFITSCKADSLTLTSDKILSKPNSTTLSFWITQQVRQDDFKDCKYLPGLIGGSEYLDSRYEVDVTKDETGYKSYAAPTFSVVYTVTNYPDYSSTTSCVTKIVITDPEIIVYGLTINSKIDEIQKTMLSNKFEKASDKSFLKNNCSIVFEKESILLGAKVTNVDNIIF